jgi:hypothetical protein
MLEPYFEHNRKEFDKLQRRQILTCVLSVAAAAVFLLVSVVLIGNRKFAEWGLYSLLATGFVILGILEVKRTLVFRRDLREQRENHEIKRQ